MGSDGYPGTKPDESSQAFPTDDVDVGTKSREEAQHQLGTGGHYIYKFWRKECQCLAVSRDEVSSVGADDLEVIPAQNLVEVANCRLAHVSPESWVMVP